MFNQADFRSIHLLPCSPLVVLPHVILWQSFSVAHNAVGDLHGDWRKAIGALATARVITVTEDDEVVWNGGDTTVVQVGDVLDRGDHEIGEKAAAMHCVGSSSAFTMHLVLNNSITTVNTCMVFLHLFM